MWRARVPVPPVMTTVYIGSQPGVPAEFWPASGPGGVAAVIRGRHAVPSRSTTSASPGGQRGAERARGGFGIAVDEDEAVRVFGLRGADEPPDRGGGQVGIRRVHGGAGQDGQPGTGQPVLRQEGPHHTECAFEHGVGAGDDVTVRCGHPVQQHVRWCVEGGAQVG